jgi:hypothetical protein
MPLSDLVSTLQLSIGPVILISGVGLLLLSMTNRLGRVIDRSRILAEGYGAATEADRPLVIAQLRILAARARIVRRAIALATFSVLLAALLIITLFAGVLLDLAITGILIGLFVLCMLALIVSLLYFLSDINLTLRALWLEIPAEARQPA